MGIGSTQRYVKRRSRSAYMTTMVSMALMLFFLGLFASYLILGSQFSKRIQEAVRLEIQIHDGVAAEDLDRFARDLGQAPYAESVEYVSKADALVEYQQRFGTEVTDMLDGFNPLLASFRVKLWASFIRKDALEEMEKSLSQDHVVASIEYPLEAMLSLQKNMQRIAWMTLVLGILLLAIAFYLIFGTIRLGIYARRLAIRTMQLIGATEQFIRKPFMIRGVVQGGMAGALACIMIILAWWALSVWAPDPLPIWQLASGTFIGLLGGILLLGLLLGWAGSYLAVNRYLNKDLDQLMKD